MLCVWIKSTFIEYLGGGWHWAGCRSCQEGNRFAFHLRAWLSLGTANKQGQEMQPTGKIFQINAL